MVVIFHNWRLVQIDELNVFMIIQLDENTKIKDIEEEFSLFYPFLKVELHPLGGWKESHKSDTLEVYGDMSAV